MKKFSIRTVENLQTALKNLTTQDEIEAVFNNATLKVLRDYISGLSGHDPRYNKETREFIIETLIEWTLDEIAEQKEIEEFKALSFDEQIEYLKTAKSLYFVRFMNLCKMKAKIYTVYPNQARKLNLYDKNVIFTWFEKVIKELRNPTRIIFDDYEPNPLDDKFNDSLDFESVKGFCADITSKQLSDYYDKLADVLYCISTIKVTQRDRIRKILNYLDRTYYGCEEEKW